MRFGPWYDLVDAERHAPVAPGLLQVRVRQGLLDYPRGKSAMVHYAAAHDLRAALVELAGQLDSRAGAFALAAPGASPGQFCGRDLLARHTVEMASHEAADLDAALARLVDGFERRFGARPALVP